MNTFPDTVKFKFFDIVRLRTAIDEMPERGQVIGILFKPSGVLYQVQWGIQRDGMYYAEELTTELEQAFA